MTSFRSFQVLLTDLPWQDDSIERDILNEIDAKVIRASATDETTLCTLARNVDAIGTCWANVTARVIDSSPQCQTIVRYGIGLDNIDVEHATRLKIPISNVPDYCVEEVADHTLALLLACARNITWFHQHTKQGIYQLENAPTMRRLSDQTLGVVGLGRIGSRLVQKATGIGMKVIGHNRSYISSLKEIEQVNLSALLKRSDFVSLHVPLTKETHHLIGSEELSLMKPTAVLINTSRGGLIEMDTLQEAICSNNLAGAALDVFSPEPPDLNQPLFQHPRVIATPHAAFVSVESLNDLRNRATRQICQVLQGNKPHNLINPDIYFR